MNMKKITLAFVLSLTACASSTGVMKMGRDTYTITTGASPVRGGMGGARESAFAEATEYCAKMNKEILVTNENGTGTNTNGFAGGSSRLTFRCLDANDPEMSQRPVYEPAPTVNINVQ
jgi:hypothetical protein